MMLYKQLDVLSDGEARQILDEHNISDDQVQQILDEHRDSHPINAALQTLAAFVIDAEDCNGCIAPQNVLYLSKAVHQAIELLLLECNALAKENSILRQRNQELICVSVSNISQIEGHV